MQRGNPRWSEEFTTADAVAELPITLQDGEVGEEVTFEKLGEGIG